MHFAQKDVNELIVASCLIFDSRCIASMTSGIIASLVIKLTKEKVPVKNNGTDKNIIRSWLPCGGVRPNLNSKNGRDWNIPIVIKLKITIFFYQIFLQVLELLAS